MGLLFWRKKPQSSEKVIIDLSVGATLADDYILPHALKESLLSRDLRLDVTLEKAENLIQKWEQKHSIALIKEAYNTRNWPIVHALGEARIRIQNERDVHIYLLRAYYSCEEWDACTSICNSLLAFDTNNIDAYRFLARCAKNKSELDIAEENYLQILAIEKFDLDSLLSLIRLKYNENNHMQVIEYAKLVIQENPNVRDGYLFMARSRMTLEEYQKSLESLFQLLSMDKNDLEVLVSLGKSLHNLEQYHEAMGYLERALEIDPDERRSRRTLALIYDRLGKSEKALGLYTKECIFEPFMFSNWEKKIILLYRLNREDEARDCIPQLLELGHFSLRSYLLAQEIALSFYWADICSEMYSYSYEKWGGNDDFFLRVARTSLKSGCLMDASRNILLGLQKTPKRKELLDLQKQLAAFLKETNTPRKLLKQALASEESLLEVECHIMNLIKTASKIKPYSVSDSKSNVLMISSSLGRGGAERQVVSCLSGLVKDLKFEQTKLYCYSINGSRGHVETYESEVRELGVEIHEFGKRNNWTSGFDRAEVLLKPWKQFLDRLPIAMRRDIEPLYLNFSREKPQIVHAWQDQTNINVAIAGLMAGVPGIVMFARSLRPDGKTMMHIRNRPYLRRAYQTIFKHATRALLCHNSSAGAESYSKWVGQKENSFEIIHNGVNFEAIEKASVDSSINEILQLPEKSIVIGGVFRLVIEKRPKLWVEAISKVIHEKENVIGVHVGGGSHSESLQTYINDLGLNDKIHLVGQTKHVKAWLDGFDLFLLTSVVEGLPNVLIEAQAFGVPVVSTDAGGAKDTFIDGETGVLVTEPTADVLAKTMLQCLDDPEWMEAARFNSRATARERFSQESMITRLKEIYELALQRT